SGAAQLRTEAFERLDLAFEPRALAPELLGELAVVPYLRPLELGTHLGEAALLGRQVKDTPLGPRRAARGLRVSDKERSGLARCTASSFQSRRFYTIIAGKPAVHPGASRRMRRARGRSIPRPCRRHPRHDGTTCARGAPARGRLAVRDRAPRASPVRRARALPRSERRRARVQ